MHIMITYHVSLKVVFIDGIVNLRFYADIYIYVFLKLCSVLSSYFDDKSVFVLFCYGHLVKITYASTNWLPINPCYMSESTEVTTLVWNLLYF